MKAEYGKYYLLNSSKSYFCVDIQRSVIFQGTLAVKCGSGYGDSGHFGYLIDTSEKFGPDYETKNEIEFSDEDIIGEYNLKNTPLTYMDFSEDIAYFNKALYEATMLPKKYLPDCYFKSVELLNNLK